MGVVYGKKLGQDRTNLFYICIHCGGWQARKVLAGPLVWEPFLKNLHLALYACLVIKDASLHFIWVSLVDGVGGVGTSSSTGFLVLMTRN